MFETTPTSEKEKIGIKPSETRDGNKDSGERKR
jgi:hypothetical protein